MRCLPATLPTLTIADTVLSEADHGFANADVTISLSEPSALPVKFSYITRNQTAFSSVDFTAARGIVSIPPGQTTAVVSIPIKGDVTWEADEVFQILLSSPINATIARTSGTVLIQNNDPLPAISISDATVIEAQSARVIVSLSNPSS
ncbi:MAG: Calx-beta domain-containing protein, partial [Planctomycetota bacterium]